MRELWRIRSKRIFRLLHADGLRARNGPVRMMYLPLSTERPQLAMAIGRKFGTAVERNRARRRLRHAFADAWQSFEPPAGCEHPHGAYLISGQRSLLTAPYPTVVEAIGTCLTRVAGTAGPRSGVGSS